MKKLYIYTKQILKWFYFGITNLYGNWIYLLHRKEYQKMLQAYKNKYKGKICFVIGNGPSLLAEDLDKLKEKNVVTFAANRIYRIFKDTKWRPTYISIDDEGYSRNKKFLEEFIRCNQQMIFTNSQYTNRLQNLNTKICFIKTRTSRKYLKNPKFSKNLLDGIYSIATVTYFNLQLAYFMGFRTIYLLGVDHKYEVEQLSDGRVIHNKDVSSYFKNGASGMKQPPIARPEESDAAYQCAFESMKCFHFKIYNATRGGALEQFERVDFDTVISQINKRNKKVYKCERENLKHE